MKVDGSGVTIVGTIVKINSGGAPRLGSGVTSTAPTRPTRPKERGGGEAGRAGHRRRREDRAEVVLRG